MGAASSSCSVPGAHRGSVPECGELRDDVALRGAIDETGFDIG
jgi:hypothetical protein